MRILTKLVLLLATITLSIHYYCQIGQCSAELQRVCHYTTPSVWEELLVEKNEFYRNELNPRVQNLKLHISKINSQYQEKIIPRLVDWGNEFYFEVVSPRIESVCQFWEEFDFNAYREWSLRQIRGIRKQVWFYYSVYVRPSLVKLDNQYALNDKYEEIRRKIAPVVIRTTQKLQVVCREAISRVLPYWQTGKRAVGTKYGVISSQLWKRCKTNELCFKANIQLKNVWKSLELGYEFLRLYIRDALAPYTDELELEVRAMKKKQRSKPRVRASANAKGNARAGAKAGAGAGTDKTVLSATANPTTSATTVWVPSDSIDSDEPLQTTTSTILRTVTMNNDKNQLSSPKHTAEAELEISQLDAIKDEFDAWFKVVDQKSSGVVKTFTKEVNKYLNERVKQLDPVFQNETQNATRSMQAHYKKINRAIQDINCTCETNTTSGNVTCFDSTGTTQLPEYITRAKVRKLFADAHNTLDESMLRLKKRLEPVAQDVDKKVNLIREELLEVYEEWGDAMITEWSKRLAYMDVVAGNLENNANEESSESWRKFLALKKQVIKARDALAEYPADLQEIKQFAKKVHYLVEILTNEAGEYLYILRAKANLAFQAREQEAKKSEDSLRVRQTSAQSRIISNSSSVRPSNETAARSNVTLQN